MSLSPTAKGNGIDKAVEFLLPDIGYAVDVGANNGICLSNTKLFEDKGWTVLCVEANPLLLEEGRQNRKLWVQAACGAVDAEDVVFTSCGEYPYAAGSGFHPYSNELAKVEFKVKMRRLDTLLEEAGFPKLDLLSIDVEWAEMEVLRGLSFDVWKPTVVIAEALAPPQVYELKTFMAAKGYEFVAVMEFDHAFKLK